MAAWWEDAPFVIADKAQDWWKDAPEAKGGPSLSEIGKDVAKSGGVGIGRGFIGLAGLPGDAANMLNMGIDKGLSYLGIESKTGPAVLPTSQSIQKNVEGVTGEFYKPQTVYGEYAQTVGEFAPAALAGPGGIGRRMLSQAVAPGIASEAAGQATKGTAAEPYARFGGAVAGSLGPAMLSRAANPLRPSAERRAAADVLRQENIPVTAGQITGSPLVKALESPFGGNYEGQLAHLTEAAMRRTGETGGLATRQNIAAMERRIGQQFDDLAARNVMAVDPPLKHGVGKAIDDYFSLVEAPNRAPAVLNYGKEIAAQAQQNGGRIPGEVYQSLRSRMETTARNMGNNPEARSAIREMREVLDDGMERSIAAGNPADLGAWRETRNQYRNSLVIKDAITGGGENVSLGLLTPGQLSQSVTRKHGRSNRARGQGDFAELADAASALLRPLPNSGTPVRLAASAIGAGLGSVSQDAMGAALGAIAGPAVVAGAVRNPLSQAYLAGRIPLQSLLANPSSTAARDALAQALLRSPQAAQYLGYPQ